MQEIFENVREEVRKMAKIIWKVALLQKTPINIAKFLDTATEYYRNFYTEEEIEFLQFYFHTQMEMMKK